MRNKSNPMYNNTLHTVALYADTHHNKSLVGLVAPPGEREIGYLCSAERTLSGSGAALCDGDRDSVFSAASCSHPSTSVLFDRFHKKTKRATTTHQRVVGLAERLGALRIRYNETACEVHSVVHLGMCGFKAGVFCRVTQKKSNNGTERRKRKNVSAL